MSIPTIDVFAPGAVAFESGDPDRDTAAPQPTVSIYLPGVDDVSDHLKSVSWKGYNVAIEKIGTHGTYDVISTEASQQIKNHHRTNHVAEAIAKREEAEAEREQHVLDYTLLAAPSGMEADLSEVIKSGKVTGVYLVEPRTAYGAEFMELLSQTLGNNLYNNVVEAEQGLQRRLYRGA